MDVKNYGKGKVIFRQGDAASCMYEIENGSVGIYSDYGGADEKRIARLMPSDVFGEMGLLDQAPRSATAVALEETILTEISEGDFYAYFEKNPAVILQLMQQMCSRLRNTTNDYLEACRTVYETDKAEKEGRERSPGLLERIRNFCEIYKGFRGAK